MEKILTGELIMRDPRDGMGLSVYLRKKLNINSAIVESMIRKGLVTINGRVVRSTRYPVYPDDIIEITGRD